MTKTPVSTPNLSDSKLQDSQLLKPVHLAQSLTQPTINNIGIWRRLRQWSNTIGTQNEVCYRFVPKPYSVSAFHKQRLSCWMVLNQLLLCCTLSTYNPCMIHRIFQTISLDPKKKKNSIRREQIVVRNPTCHLLDIHSR